jgi:predicted phosphodiesterase
MKPIKFVACGDIHGDEQDAPSVKALLAFTKEYQPDLVVCIGDLWDFRAIRKGAGDEEQASSLQKDWDCGEEFIREFFKFGDERVFLRGNHDERIYDMSKNSRSGVARDYANDGIENIELIMKETKARMFPYDSVVESTSAAGFRLFTATATPCTAVSNTPMPTAMLSSATPTPLIILVASPLTLELAGISDASATRPQNTTEANCGGYAGNTAGRMGQSIPTKPTMFFKHDRRGNKFHLPTNIKSF